MVSEIKVKAEKLRDRLLDLSGRNNFIKYNHASDKKKQKFLRFVNEVPELLIQKLRKGTRYQLLAKPNEANYDFNLPFVTAKNGALFRKSSKTIQVYESDPKFELSCNSIRLDSNSYQKDKGINVLYVAIGFLQYPTYKGIVSQTNSKDKSSSQKTIPTEAYAPLILYPVKLTREKTASGFNYYLETSEEEIILNRSLKAKLAKEEGISLPDLKYENEDTPLIEEYFKRIFLALSEKNETEGTKQWQLKRWATLVIFKFGKLAIFEDINFDSWTQNPLLEKQLVQDFINGVPSNSVEELGDMKIYQDDFEKVQLVDQIPKLIAEADSTQYKVIIKALEGKSMAIQGPPGTGKSQTITNIIGGLLVKNKKVLFAADKFTALEVVKQRLSQKNLGEYILELHNATKSKRAFHENLFSRLGKPSARFSSNSYESSFRQLKSLRKELNDHVNAINKKLNLNGINTSVFDLIWKDILNKFNLGKSTKFEIVKQLEDKFLSQFISEIDIENIAIIKSNLDLLSELSESSKTDQFLKLSQIKGLPDTGDELSKLIRLSTKLSNLINVFQIKLKKENINYLSLLELNRENLNIEIENFEELISEKFINKSFTIKDDISEQLANIYKLVVEKEAQENYIEEWAKPFLENQKKFDLFETCLKGIEKIEPRDKTLTIENILDDLKDLFKSSNLLIRDIAKDDRRIISKLSYENLINTFSCFKEINKKYSDLTEDILVLLSKSKNANDLETLIKKINQIKKNNNEGIS